MSPLISRIFRGVLGSLAISIAAEGDTKKVYESAGERFQLELLTQQKDVVWGFDFLVADQIIFTERGDLLGQTRSNLCVKMGLLKILVTKLKILKGVIEWTPIGFLLPNLYFCQK